jgi:hypothetical protein
MNPDVTVGAIVTTSPNTVAVYFPELSLVAVTARAEITLRVTPEIGRRPLGVLL